ncbi:hypothetical protein HUT18_07070 [Streptomyces sp. NA04227]|uniref:DUF6177 family protein n=1 Tax=Streptomyces sp. NA04227 TaxID=2742136 RepID=UPI00158FB85A|nr:DUF6177 family protein [Streptomyces sp. NA04227]QKW06200.1 hypothetical protein HUT18_07070 [Streptomyces sp. NA04227]
MTKDVIALTPKMPDARTLIAGLYAGGPDLALGSVHEDAIIQLRSRDGRPLVSVEAPVLVQVPGEAERLLGSELPLPQGPFWWTEARATTAVAGAEQLAGSLCARLVALLGGTAWPPGTAALGVVRIPGEEGTEAEGGHDPLAEDEAPEQTSDRTREQTSEGTREEALPAVDVLTPSTAVVLADRPVVPLTAWLSEVLRATADSGRALHIVTPSHARLSLPLRTALTGAPNRWVVQDPESGYYDGLSGAQLHWHDGTFTPRPQGSENGGPTPVAKAFGEPSEASGQGQQLVLSFRVLHEASAALELGGALEEAWNALTGTPPLGWGTAEPVNSPWSKRQLTDLARGRAPQPTQFLAVGAPDRPALAVERVSRTRGGVAEDVTLTVGWSTDETLPLDAIEALARTLVAEHGLTAMLASVRTARRDLAVPPHFEPPPAPVSFTLGATDVRNIGLTHARRPPLPLRSVQLGPATAPALHYRLGEGRDANAWTALEQLTAHLGQAHVS